ncbi:MAG TPA: alpha/beta fold hydrolase, partial [Myxococcota bacterium]|nr:alpha/beta fold hydrolase [Myxococcota bacterium]
MQRLSLFLVMLFSFQEVYSLVEIDDAKTQYPLVLVPGMSGFDNLFGYAYFGQMPDRLTDNGAKVYVVKHSSVHGVEYRGEQLYRWLKKWGHEKYNLIGHSQGGLDARYVRAKYPELVASVTTVSTPHRGAQLADFLYEKIGAIPLVATMVWQTGDVCAYAVGVLSGNWQWQNFKRATMSLTKKWLKEFNEKHEASLNLESQMVSPPIFSCGTIDVKPSGVTDLCGIVMKWVGWLFHGNEDNDGLVAKNSMKCGEWIGEIAGAHHLFP